MQLFVTGGTGFVGAHFINTAHQAGHKIIALRRPGAQPRIPLIQEPTWIEGDLLGDYDNVLQSCQCLVHFAAHSPNPPYDSFDHCFYWNVYASMRLAEQARRAGIQDYVIAGSSFEYGSPASAYERIPADAPLFPAMSYPSSKAAASIGFTAFAKTHHLRLKILRIFQVYGEGEPEGRLWPTVRRLAQSGADFDLTPGEQLRDFIPVEAVAEAFCQAIDFAELQAGQILIQNIGSGQILSVRQFVEQHWQHWQATGTVKVGAVPYRENEMMTLIPSLKSVII